MSELPSTSTCSTCGNELPAGARFCPECGGRVDAAAPEEGLSPVAGWMLPLLAIALVVLVLAIVLLVVGSWIVGAILLAVAAALGAISAASARPARRLTAVRARGRAVVETVAAQAQAQKELVALRLEVQRLNGERAARLRRLGDAVYRDDAEGTEAARTALRELDDRIAAKEVEMQNVAERTRERVGQARLEAQPTVLLEPPAPPQTPEPYPPPVPEPYPPPDEGTPPTPEPVPEPYPPPDEGDLPRQP